MFSFLEGKRAAHKKCEAIRMRHHMHRRQVGPPTHCLFLQENLQRVACDCEHEQCHPDGRGGRAIDSRPRVGQREAHQTNAQQEGRETVGERVMLVKDQGADCVRVKGGSLFIARYGSRAAES